MWPEQPTIPLVQAIVRLPDDMDPHSSRVWFRPEDTPYFYWLIPHSESHGALGIIGDRPEGIRARFENFAAERSMPPLEFQGARIPLYTSWRPIHRRFHGGDVYLVGDAAGQVKVSTVGGLVTGFRGAAAVVQSILIGRPARRARSLRIELEAHRLIRKTLHDFTQDDYVGLFKLLNDPMVTSLGKTGRDEAAKALFKAFVAQPRFLAYSLRALLGRGSFPSS
jgi:flavin-dependent dehydrogenase